MMPGPKAGLRVHVGLVHGQLNRGGGTGDGRGLGG